MPCPDDNSLNRYVDGRAGEAEKAELENHFEECPLCKELVRDFFARPTADPGESESIRHADDTAVLAARLADELDPMVPGKKVGRYIVLELVGKGAMGEVYSAYDPQLDRRVALKVLHSDVTEVLPGASRPAQTRLLREARAMAKVTHPNVITVHDVQSCGGQIAIAMEFVSGCTLRQWVKTEHRSWREVLAVFVQAGKRLAAAHKAGLVHRDFKPENVIVGSDGRVLVTDFGLVRSSVPDELERSFSAQLDTSRETAQSASHLSTKTGSLLGTPAYMAPEQFAGLEIDSRADQYSFCVALWEALYGHRPVFGGSFTEQKRKTLAGEISTPQRPTDIPKKIQNALERGLATQPGKRFQTMNALLTAFETSSTPRRRAYLTLAALAFATIAVGFAAFVLRPEQRPQCTPPPNEFAGVWDVETRQAIKRAFFAADPPFARDTYSRLEEHLNQYVSRFNTALVQSCEDAHIHGLLSVESLETRVACLREQKAAFGALTRRLTAAVDKVVVQNSIKAALDLPRATDCYAKSGVAAATSLEGYPQEVRARLHEIEVLHSLGKYNELLPIVEQLKESTHAKGDMRSFARSLYCSRRTTTWSALPPH